MTFTRLRPGHAHAQRRDERARWAEQHSGPQTELGGLLVDEEELGRGVIFGEDGDGEPTPPRMLSKDELERELGDDDARDPCFAALEGATLLPIRRRRARRWANATPLGNG